MNDSGVIFPSLRITHLLSDSAETESENKKSRLAIEFNLDYASGSGSESISSSQFINFGGSRFDGPAEIRGRGDLYVASLLVRKRLNNPASFYGIDLLGGVSLQKFDLRLDSDGVVVEDGMTTGGPMVGVQFSVMPYSWGELYLRAMGALGFGGLDSKLGWGEVGITIRPYPPLGIMGGYRSLSYWQGSMYPSGTSPNVAEITFGLNGPVVGLQLEF